MHPVSRQSPSSFRCRDISTIEIRSYFIMDSSNLDGRMSISDWIANNHLHVCTIMQLAFVDVLEEVLYTLDGCTYLKMYVPSVLLEKVSIVWNNIYLLQTNLSSPNSRIPELFEVTDCQQLQFQLGLFYHHFSFGKLGSHKCSQASHL